MNSETTAATMRVPKAPVFMDVDQPERSGVPMHERTHQGTKSSRSKHTLSIPLETTVGFVHATTHAVLYGLSFVCKHVHFDSLLVLATYVASMVGLAKRCATNDLFPTSSFFCRCSEELLWVHHRLRLFAIPAYYLFA